MAIEDNSSDNSNSNLPTLVKGVETVPQQSTLVMPMINYVKLFSNVSNIEVFNLIIVTIV